MKMIRSLEAAAAATTLNNFPCQLVELGRRRQQISRPFFVLPLASANFFSFSFLFLDWLGFVEPQFSDADDDSIAAGDDERQPRLFSSTLAVVRRPEDHRSVVGRLQISHFNFANATAASERGTPLEQSRRSTVGRSAGWQREANNNIGEE